MAATFLDALSVDAVVNILRFFSDHPRASNWESYVQMEVLFVLYCSSGRLSEICREHFTEVCIDGGDEAHATALTLRKRESFLCNKEKLEKKRMRMMQIGAQNIAKLFAYRPLFRGTHKRLINLKELELVHTSHDVANILNGLPSQLDALYLRFALSKMQIDAIAMYCKRLCKLETQLGEHDFEKLFESVGPGLEHFAVHFYSRKLSSKNLFHIKKYCRNLYSLGLGYFPTSDAQDVTD